MFKNIVEFKNFQLNRKINSKKLYRILSSLKHQNNNNLLKSLSKSYNYSFKKKTLNKFRKEKTFKIIGMGGSILGAEAIYSFLKCKKKFYFINNLQNDLRLDKKTKSINIIISKSGNTLETISNINLYLKKKDKNIIITEKKNNYLFKLANKLKCEIIEHNNFIGGRYSVLSEVGMVPAVLMGFDEKKFKQYDNLIKNKYFINKLVQNVGCLIHLCKNKQNSIILNYDEYSDNFFKWYQQLVAESLGKKSKGIFPIISTMPKDNHSLMQYFLDGPKKNFYTFFSINEKKSPILNNKNLLLNQKKLYNKKIIQIINAQKIATENVFLKKNIPFRSFTINQRSEKTLGALFSFFILETILLGKALNLNPFDQPAVELIKTETKKLF
mgnify:FL=1|tara:strand:+ start:3211 stop:4362 length:1152 start_codon:yes stop_codon:yes gene_type:complete